MRHLLLLPLTFLTFCNSDNLTSNAVSKKYKQGELRTYYSNGALLKIENYKNDTLNGLSLIYSENGKLYTSANYKMGSLIDSFKHFHSNGAINYEKWYDSTGKQQGLFKVYYDNGQLRQIGTMKDNHLEDTIKIYYPNGRIKSIEFYKNQKREGNWLYYDENGILTKTETYSNNSLH